MARRNFARGEAPPPHSYEWAGVAKPPEGKRAQARGPGVPVIVATMQETIVVERKRRPWLWMAGGGVLGFFLGYSKGKR
jgi:hypothetical protein